MYDPFLTEETFFVATKCCLFNSGKILILSENRPGRPLWWELPGGKISKADHDLSPIESLARELREELWSDYDILLSDPQLFTVHKSYEDTTFSDKKVPFMFLCYFHEISDNFSLSLSHEHTEFRWITQSDISTIQDWREWFDSIVRNAFLYAN